MVEEVLRHANPLHYFRRTATEDTVLHDVPIATGDKVVMVYTSANRDEDVFPDPFVFRVDRTPNPHIGFGMGEHVCLGAHLARLELRCAFAALLDRLEHCEPTGPVARMRSSFVGGIKRAPMRWRIRPR